MRICWEEFCLNLAVVASKRSEDPHKQVGACALDHDHRVLGVAYNGLASGKNVPNSFWDDRNKRRPFMLHAEVNMCSLFKRKEASMLACTLLPCTSCAQMIAAWGIPKVIYLEEYTKDQTAKEIFKFYGIELLKLDRDPDAEMLVPGYNHNSIV